MSRHTPNHDEQLRRVNYWHREESYAAQEEHRANDHAEKARWHERRWFCLLRALDILEGRATR